MLTDVFLFGGMLIPISSHLLFGLFCGSLLTLSPYLCLIPYALRLVCRVLALRQSIPCYPIQVLPLIGRGLPYPPQGFHLINLLPILPHLLLGLLCRSFVKIGVSLLLLQLGMVEGKPCLVRVKPCLMQDKRGMVGGKPCLVQVKPCLK